MNTAISTNFLLWALLVFSCPDPGCTTPAEEMASLEVKITNIMDRMTRMEAEMVAKDEMVEVLETAIETLEDAMQIKDQRISVLEADMEIKAKRIAVLEDIIEDAAMTKDVFTDTIKTRDIQMWELEEEMRSLTGRLNEVRNPPFAFQCGWRYDQWTAADSVITVVPTWIEQSIPPTNTFI